ncbi:hypothetical protein Tco_1211943 [Tanacetum coccineum]
MWSKKTKQDSNVQSDQGNGRKDKGQAGTVVGAKANGSKGVISTNQFEALENMYDPFDFNDVGQSSKWNISVENFVTNEVESDSEVDEVLIMEKHRNEHEESVPTPSNDPQASGEDSMKLTDLMVLCNKLQTQVLDLQKAKDAQAKEIRIESSEDQESLGVPEDASKQGRSIEDIDADVDEMLVEAKVDGKDEQSTKKLDDSTTGEAATTAGDDSVEPSEFRVPQEIKPSSSKDKGKVYDEPDVLFLKRKINSLLMYKLQENIQAKLDVELLEEQKLQGQEDEEANIAWIVV